MSEQLLKAIIRLLAILARVDGISKYEKKTIRNFLFDRLNEDTAREYLEIFNNLLTEYDQLDKSVDEHLRKKIELKEIDKLSRQINNELTQHQKIVLVLDVITLTIADGKITAGEEEIVKKIGEAIRVEQTDIDSIKEFAIANRPEDFNKPVFLIAGDFGKVTIDKVQYIKIPQLEGFIAILELKNYTGAYFMKYIGPLQVFLNNIPVKNGEMRVVPSGSAIRSPDQNNLYYSDIVSAFKKHEPGTEISFIAENIEYRFKSGEWGLRKINIKEESGALIGIMGSSGSGKSTLLNVLNGNVRPTAGNVRINGIDIHKDKNKIEGVIGYVPQDDLLMEELTVFQNLYYAAKLCFNNLNEHKINDLVEQTISNLGLSETKNLRVGTPLDATISGGQRKRLNIGLELLREPAVMFVDEPTSGLSSRDSENIMDLLKELSLKGKLIFVVIHQPSSNIFKLFDRLIILDVGGYQIYYGNPVEAVVYFKKEFHFVDSDQGACIACGNINPEQIFTIIETKVVNEFGRLTKERKVKPQQWHDIFSIRILPNEIEEQHEKLNSSLKIPNRFKQFKIFAARDILSKLSNRQYLLINLLEAPLLAILLAFTVRWYPMIGSHSVEEYHFSTNVNIPAYIFMSVIVALFMGLTVSAEEIIHDRKILKRESFLNLSRSSYIYSKLFILFSLSAIQTLTYTVLGNTILEIRGMLLPFWLILFTTSCFANVLGLNISSAFNSAVTIYILIPILLIPQLLLSGVVVKFDELNPVISSRDKVPLIGDLMASRWAFEASMVTQFKNNRFEKPFFNLDQQIGNSEFKYIYAVPALQDNLEYCHRNYLNTHPGNTDDLKNDLALLRNEVGQELRRFGSENLPVYDKLNVKEFDENVYNETRDFLATLKRVYINRYKEALHKKEQIINSISGSPQKRIAFEDLKKNYYNERIEDMVKNSNDAIRIMRYKNKLIQKIYPIFQIKENPRNLFDFRTIFYAPQKYFLGLHVDTLWFNVAMIGFMTVVLVITLYFDMLRWLVELPGNLQLGKASAST